MTYKTRNSYSSLSKPAQALVKKFNPNHDPKTGKFASRGLAGSAFTDQDRALVDYSTEKRPLADPRKIRAIDKFIPGAQYTPYTKVPFFDRMMNMQGNRGELDGNANEEARNKLFRQQPIEEVNIKDLHFTQDVVNADNIAFQVHRNMDSPSGAVLVARHGGKHYLMDGHHRAIGEHVRGKTKTRAHVLDFDKVQKGEGAFAHVFKFNPNHDSKNGQFTSGPGGSAAPSGEVDDRSIALKHAEAVRKKAEAIERDISPLLKKLEC